MELATRRVLIPIIVLALVVVSFTVLYRTDTPSMPSLRWGLIPPPTDAGAPAVTPTADALMSADQLESKDVELERILKAADMGNKTVIVTTLNAAWAEPGSILDLFFEGFRIGNGTRELLKHLVIITTDQKAYQRCMSVHTHCFNLNTEGLDFSGEQVFNTADYVEMMWRRLDFLRLVLEKGYSFIFTDVDILWLRNPLPHLYAEGDIQISCDRFFGNATGLDNLPSNGFLYVKSMNRTIEFYKYWYSFRSKYPAGKNEQDVFVYLMNDQLVRDIGLKIMFLDTKYFSGLCEVSRDMDVICTMHVNCRVGLKNKLSELRRMLDEWRNYMSDMQ